MVAVVLAVSFGGSDYTAGLATRVTSVIRAGLCLAGTSVALIAVAGAGAG